MILRKISLSFIKTWIALFLMLSLSNTYAKKQGASEMSVSEAITTVAVDASSACSDDNPCEVATNEADDLATINGSDSCEGLDNCTVAVSCEDNPNADACYSAPSVQPSKITRKYMQNGCEITEYGQEAVMDCSMKK